MTDPFAPLALLRCDCGVLCGEHYADAACALCPMVCPLRAEWMRAFRRNQPPVTAEQAYAQQAAALRGETGAPSEEKRAELLKNARFLLPLHAPRPSKP